MLAKIVRQFSCIVQLEAWSIKLCLFASANNLERRPRMIVSRNAEQEVYKASKPPFACFHLFDFYLIHQPVILVALLSKLWLFKRTVLMST